MDIDAHLAVLEVVDLDGRNDRFGQGQRDVHAAFFNFLPFPILDAHVQPLVRGKSRSGLARRGRQARSDRQPQDSRNRDKVFHGWHLLPQSVMLLLTEAHRGKFRDSAGKYASSFLAGGNSPATGEVRCPLLARYWTASTRPRGSRDDTCRPSCRPCSTPRPPGSKKKHAWCRLHLLAKSRFSSPGPGGSRAERSCSSMGWWAPRNRDTCAARLRWHASEAG